MTSSDRRLAPRGGPRPDRALERDACGIGFVADVTGRTDRRVVELGLQGLSKLRHRGAFASDEQTGDGAGVLFPIPRRMLSRGFGSALPDVAELGLLMLFISDRRSTGEVCAAVEDACERERLQILRWRDVPVEPSALGEHARATRPRILQAVLRAPRTDQPARSEQRAHRARRRIDAFARAADRDVYVASCSFTTVTYKALAAADRLASFYPDLRDPDVEAPFIVFHQRYSTNTAPTWERAQPFRMLCHNGEINTIAGNANRMHAREGSLGFATLAEEALFSPAIDDRGSDSAILDETVEILTKEGGDRLVGRDIRRAIAMLVPAAWEDAPEMTPERRAFYRWHASLMEPWDGPAALIFTDGVAVGASLDRNGLRPLRYWASGTGLVVCASEAGIVDLPGPIRRGKIGPGQMIVVDPRNGGLDDDAVRSLADAHPWGAWAEDHRIARLPEMPRSECSREDELVSRQILHGYTREDLTMMLRPSAAHGKEPTFSMGDDTPIAALSRHERSIFNHFRQRFAQVTNPAMDHLRERSVMSLAVLLGPRAPLLSDAPGAAALEELESFFQWERPSGRRLDATWRARRGPTGLRTALRRLGSEAVAAAADGEPVLVVSDQAAGPDRAPIPSVLAVGAVNVALTLAGMRTRCSVVAEVDDARESHHVACLLAVGAEAIRLPLAAATVAAQARSGGGDEEAISSALTRYREAIEDGIRKTLAKLGISCVDSYRGAEVVDMLGLDDEIARTCFVSTPTALGGLGMDEVGAAVLERHANAYAAAPALANPGYVKFRNGGEHHATAPPVVRAAHRVADPLLERLRTNASGAKGGAEDEDMRAAHALGRAVAHPERPELYATYASIVHARPRHRCGTCWSWSPADAPFRSTRSSRSRRSSRRFSTGAISHGSISAEAHETLAIAMNAIGGRSNCGEGGEDPARYRHARTNSRIKQIASGRFGVTPEYCAFADELNIKIAQGSKPGEGGQLPGHKVTAEIARLRHTQPGVGLISPPPAPRHLLDRGSRAARSST